MVLVAYTQKISLNQASLSTHARILKYVFVVTWIKRLNLDYSITILFFKEG
jgi:hypothetical protein